MKKSFSKKIISFLTAFVLICGAVPLGTLAAEEENSFYLTASTSGETLIEPVSVPYTEEQTVKQALLASGFEFGGLENGFITDIEGTSGNFSMFYDGGGYDLDVPASEITALIFTETTEYDQEIINLVAYMGECREENENALNYPAVETAYLNAINGLRTADGEQAKALRGALETAVAEYEAAIGGEKHTVSVSAAQGGAPAEDIVITLTDIYGNVTSVRGNKAEVVSGEYSFTVSDGGCNRTEGTVTVSGDTVLSVELPSGNWFGDVKILDSDKQAYDYTQNKEQNTGVYIIEDRMSHGDFFLNAMIGDVPDRDTTRLRTIYVGTNGNDTSETVRSWNSQNTSLAYLLNADMNGRNFNLEAQYENSAGHVMIQSYGVTIVRKPTLNSLSVMGDGMELLHTFSPFVNEYDITAISDTVEITGVPFSDGSTVTVNGGSTGTFAVGDGTAAEVTVTYTDGSQNTYTLHFTKADTAQVTVKAPSGTTAEVYSSSGGEAITPVKDGMYNLVPGEEYTYVTTKGTYYHASADFTASNGLTITAAEPETKDAITDFALYNNSGSNRSEYPVDREFVSSEHEYIYTVPDANSAAYAQATAAGYTVKAIYNSQHTTSSRNGVRKDTEVKKEVNAATATLLSSFVAKSGYSQNLTVRAEKVREGVTYYQDYLFQVVRSGHLEKLSLSVGGEEQLLLNAEGEPVSYNRNVTDYYVSIPSDTTELTVNSKFYNELNTSDCCGGFYAMVGGVRYDSVAEMILSLDTELETEKIEIAVCHADEDFVTTLYTITVRKIEPSYVTFKTTPEDATVFVMNNATGKTITGEGGIFALTPGASYSYTVTCSGYVGARVSEYIAPDSSETVTVSLEKAEENTSLQDLEAQWPSFRGDENNNGVVDFKTPTEPEDTVLYWATKLGEGYSSDAAGCPIIVDGYLYAYGGNNIFKVDTISGEVVAKGTMDRSSSFAINSPTYAEGMIFVGLSDGGVQAFDAVTLESLWIYNDAIGGQPNCPIYYYDGYVYTGFWRGETLDANFVCLSVTDEDLNNDKEEKLPTWTYKSRGGFYWAGAYVNDDALLVGTDDGEAGCTTGYGSILSIDRRTGALKDKITLPYTGDVRSSILYDTETESYYFTTKGGYFYSVSLESGGTFKDDSLKYIKLYNYADNAQNPAMSTCTPTVYNGRAYIGVSGTSQFGAYSGHNITVIDLKSWSIAYTVRTQGYPQTSGLITTAYEETEGVVYVYFFDNYTPGKLRILSDKPGQTAPAEVTVEEYTSAGKAESYETAKVLFTPSGAQAQYAICSPIVDEYGTIFFKNDSAYMMAVGSTIEKIEIVAPPDKTQYRAGDVFDGTGMKVMATYTNGMKRDITDYVTWSEEPLTKDDTEFLIRFEHVMYQDADGIAGTVYTAPVAVQTLTIEGERPLDPGDINGDRKTDESDAQLLYSFIQGEMELTEEQLAVSDVNEDGKVDILDVMGIYEIVSGGNR